MTNAPFPKNPYVIGVPLTGEVGFYGRRAVFTFVEDTLDTEYQNVMVLYGQRRVGKTSLLHQLVRQLKDSEVLRFTLICKAGRSNVWARCFMSWLAPLPTP